MSCIHTTLLFKVNLSPKDRYKILSRSFFELKGFADNCEDFLVMNLGNSKNKFPYQVARPLISLEEGDEGLYLPKW